jgi:hypothetical protein
LCQERAGLAGDVVDLLEHEHAVAVGCCQLGRCGRVVRGPEYPETLVVQGCHLAVGQPVRLRPAQARIVGVAVEAL